MRTLHVISHTHWDREWYQTFQQFRLRLIQLVDGLLDILANDPEFKYFMLDGQTIVLDDYLLMRPEKEQILREHIKSGRIVIGPWHILPDMFLVGPEAHIRNLLEGERTTRKFGPKMMVGYMPDSFGHFGQMPQLLRGFGIESACLWRGLDDQPAEFWWQAPDGSRVLMAYLRDGYSNGAFLPAGEDLPAEGLARFADALADCGHALAGHSAFDDLLIMLGTDHMQPPRGTSQNIAYANQHLKDTRVLHSTLEQYLAVIQAGTQQVQIPTLTGELRDCKRMHLLPGVLSTRMWIKQRNSASENLLTKWVEPFSTFAEWSEPPAGQKRENATARLAQPAALIRQTWHLLMENHPHDSICGCSIDQVHEEMKTRFDQVDQIGEELTRQSLEMLAGQINTTAAAADLSQSIGAVVVFNPSCFKRTELVSTEITIRPGASSFSILAEDGQPLAYETLGLGARELINARMNPKEIRSALQMVNEGHIMGLGVRAYHMQREGSEIHLDVTLSEGEPDYSVWERAMQQTATVFADESITVYQIRAHTPALVQVVFVAPEVPALGWRTFKVTAPLPAQTQAKESAPIQLSLLARVMLPLAGKLASLPAGQALIGRLQSEPASKPPYVIENEFFKIEVEPQGTLLVLDKSDGISYNGLNRFVDSGDCGDEYNYSPPAINPQHTPRLKHVSIQRSPVRQTLSIHMSLKIPAALSSDRKSRSHTQTEIPLTTVVTLVNGVRRIDIHTHLENHARDHRLRVHFPTLLKPDSANQDGHFEIVKRKIGIPAYDRQTWVEDPRPEVPQRAFSALSVDGHGLTLANRGLPEVEVLKTGTGTEIALTLLRCVGWLSRDDLQTRRGHAGPALQTPGAQMPGMWGFDYAIIPHSADMQTSPANQAYAFETALRTVSAIPHPGVLPGQGSFLAVECSDAPQNTGLSEFSLSSIKPAEDGSGWLVRGYNRGQAALQVKLSPNKHFEYAARINLAEYKTADLQVEKNTGSVSLPVNSHEIVTIWFGSEPKR